MRTPSVKRRGVRVAAVLVAGVLVAAACSSDDKGTPATSSPTTTLTPAPVTTGAPTTTAAPTVPPKLTFGFIASNQPLLWDIGFAQQNALTLAVEDINAGGGVLGAPVAADVAGAAVDDTQTAAITDLVDGGANALLGPMSSNDAVAALPVIAGAHSLACSASATAPNLNPAPPQAQLYRTVLPDQYTVGLVAQNIEQQRAKVAADAPWKVAIVARGDDYGASVAGGLVPLLEAQGIETTVISYLPAQTSLGDQAKAAAAFGPNNVVAVTYTEAPRLLDQLVLNGVAASKIIGLDAMFAPNLAEQTFPGEPQKLDGMTVIGVTGDRAFLRRLNALPSGQVIFGAQMYDCAIVIALAAQAANSTDPGVYAAKMNVVLSGSRPCSTYGDCLAKMSAGETIAYQGQIGSFTFGPDLTPTASRFTVANMANGTYVVAQTIDLDLTAIANAEATELATAQAIQTARIQQLLTALGFYSGPIDGQPSEALTASIIAFQAALGVPQTGVWDEATDAAAQAKYGTASQSITEATKSLQQALTDLGFYTGPIDGRYSAATADAVRALQASLGVPQTGIVDAATMQAIYAAGIASVPTTTSTTTTTAPPETTAPPTAPPTTPAPTAPPTAAPTTKPTVPPTEAPTTKPTTPPTEAPTTEKVTTTTAPPAPELPDIADALTSDPQFSIYVELLRAAGWQGAVGSLAPITVFAPTNAALNALPTGVLDALRADPATLATLLRGAVVGGSYTAATLATQTSLTTLAGTQVAVTSSGGTIQVGGATVGSPEILAENGVIQPLTSIPPPAQPR